MFNKFSELSKSNIFGSPITKASCSPESPTYRGNMMAAAAEGQAVCIYLLVFPFISDFIIALNFCIRILYNLGIILGTQSSCHFNIEDPISS